MLYCVTQGSHVLFGSGSRLELHVQRANEQGGIVLQRQRIADAQFVCLN